MDTTRINIAVDEKLKHRVKVKALKEKQTVTNVIVVLLKKWLKKGN